ncbi:DUF2807 domain-containing protein [Maribacter sp.]|nr:DUF2807 domain-containing protein [Maribacter sp.]
MKKASLFLGLMLLAVCSVMGQYTETQNFEETFDKVRLDGNIRLYLEQGTEANVRFETKSERKFEDYQISVRNNTLFVQLHKKHRYGGTRNRHSAPKIDVYVTHPELREIAMEGLVNVYSIDPITSESFSVRGDGLIRGEIEVDVAELRVDLDGLCSMRFTGKATDSNLRLDGMGKINARDLETATLHKRVDGLSRIKVAKSR